MYVRQVLFGLAFLAYATGLVKHCGYRDPGVCTCFDTDVNAWYTYSPSVCARFQVYDPFTSTTRKAGDSVATVSSTTTQPTTTTKKPKQPKKKKTLGDIVGLVPPPIVNMSSSNKGLETLSKCFATPSLSLDWTTWNDATKQTHLIILLLVLYIFMTSRNPTYSAAAAALCLFTKNFTFSTAALYTGIYTCYRLKQWVALVSLLLVFVISC